MNNGSIDILSLGSLHDAVFEFSQQKSIDSFWGAVAINARWVVPARRVCVLAGQSDSPYHAIARVEQGKLLHPIVAPLTNANDSFGDALNASGPVWIESNDGISDEDECRRWLRCDLSNILHIVPLVGATGRLGVVVFDLRRPSDNEERARITALASLYVRHAASTYAVIRSSAELATKNSELEQTQLRLMQAADEIREFNSTLEQRIEDRTQELERTQDQLMRAADEIREFNSTLERRIEDRTHELEQTQQELLEVSRRAGMAEVASALLHNVGNALSSVNMASLRIAESLQDSFGSRLRQVVSLLRENETDLDRFLTEDERGQNLIPYLEQVAERLEAEQRTSLSESTTIREGIDHIKAIVSTQQSYAGNVDVNQNFEAARLVEDALKMSWGPLQDLGIEISREFDELEKISVDRHKVMQILINLISNAKHALEGTEQPRRLVLRVLNCANDRVAIRVEDNGKGIRNEDSDRLFTHGFTTKKDGHGFGLHHSAIAAKQLGGELSFESSGPGAGAAFTLVLPKSRESHGTHDEHALCAESDAGLIQTRRWAQRCVHDPLERTGAS